jgi:hypothetical protein
MPLWLRWLLFLLWAAPLLYLGLIWRGWAKTWWQIVRGWMQDIASIFR